MQLVIGLGNSSACHRMKDSRHRTSKDQLCAGISLAWDGRSVASDGRGQRWPRSEPSNREGSPNLR